MTKLEFEDLERRFNASGTTLKSFLKAEGVAYSTYNYWSNKVREESRQLPIAPIEFHERGNIQTETAPASCGVDLPGVTLAFPNGVRAHFGGYSAAFKPGSGVSLVNCMVHIRRAFERAMDESREPATWFLVCIRQLYHIEHECDAAGMDFDQRRAARLLKSKPVMDEMKAWLETEGVKYSESSLIGKAVTYAYTRWENMERVLQDGRLLLDNNLAENEIRPITLGRKNYLFCGNHEAAANMCVIASLLATCHNHGINPRAYLTDVIATLPHFEKASQDEISMLLPHRWIEYHPEAIMPEVRKLAK